MKLIAKLVIKDTPFDPSKVYLRVSVATGLFVSKSVRAARQFL